MAYFYSIDKYIAKTIAAVDKIKRIRRIELKLLMSPLEKEKIFSLKLNMFMINN